MPQARNRKRRRNLKTSFKQKNQFKFKKVNITNPAMRKLWNNELTAKQNLEKIGLSMDTNIVVDKEKIESLVRESLSAKDIDSNKNNNQKDKGNNEKKMNDGEEEEEDIVNDEASIPKRVGYDAAVPEGYSEITSSAKGLIKTEIRKALHAKELAKLGQTTNPSTMGDQLLTELSGSKKDSQNINQDGKKLKELFDVPIGLNGDVSEIERNPRKRLMSEEDQLYVSKLIKKYKNNYKVSTIKSELPNIWMQYIYLYIYIYACII